MPPHERSLTATATLERGTDGRRVLAGRLVPYNMVSRPIPDEGGVREIILPGAVDPGSLIGQTIIDEHDGIPLAEIVEARAAMDGVHIRALAIRTPAAEAVLARHEAIGLPGLAFSVGFRSVDVEAVDGIVQRGLIDVFHAALTRNPVHPAAHVVRLRSRQGEPMHPDETETAAPDAQAPDAAASAAIAQTRADVADGERLRSLETVVADLRGRMQRGTAPDAAHPLAGIGSFGEYVRAAWEGRVHKRALADQLTTDSPDVMRPTWLTEIVGIITQMRPLVTALGGPAPLPEAGLEIDWPYYDGSLGDLVAEQLTEKTEISSNKVSLKRASVPIKTYAEGSDIALQLIERAPLNYLDAYMRILQAAWAMKTELEFVKAGTAAATGAATYSAANVDTLYQTVISTSLAIKNITGAPASVVAISHTAWPTIAGARGTDKRPLFPMMAPTNPLGQASGTGVQQIDIAGVPGIPVAGLTVPALITNAEALRWHEDGPRSIEANDVANLGMDKAIYGYGAARAAYKNAIYKVTTTA